MFSVGIRFSDVFRGYRSAALGCDGLNLLNHVKYFFCCYCSILTETSTSVALTCCTKTLKTIQKAEKPKHI